MGLTHIKKNGSVTMVDVSGKPVVKRRAVATGEIVLQKKTIRLLKKGLLKKGDALACARIAAIMAAKKTSELIPLCHALPLSHCSVDFKVESKRIIITAAVQCIARTGAEMEALTAVAVAGLTIYDMCKAVDKRMVVSKIRLLEKHKEPPA
jgi:cyclic pyranopterin monophosphate synthase